MYLMQCYTPDHRTISDFRKNNLKAIEKYFVDIVRIFSKLGYTSVGKIYLDGTKCTEAKVKELFLDIREPLLQEMREKLTSDERRRKYFMRQYIIEPVFGHLKCNVGYRNFLLEGGKRSVQSLS
ncbi:MAG: transposase [Candidatus Jettenia sp.]|nr:MAG: transposase [Candidatus Jettenia sp.]